jgi:polysaccharide export outer membrane protein
MQKLLISTAIVMFTLSPTAGAQTAVVPPAPQNGVTPVKVDPLTGIPEPPGYVIGPDDVLAIMVWGQKELSGDFQVRPDGKVSLLLVNEVQAAGLTPEGLRESLAAAYTKFVNSPTVYVAVKQINSRKVFITGQVAKPGAYDLGTEMTVVRLIAVAGGLLEYADKKNIVVLRKEKRPDGQPWMFKVNYEEILDRRRGSQDIELKPGDTILVK